jgi:hypothetical protein
MRPPPHITRNVCIGTILTLITSAAVAILIFVAGLSHLKLLLGGIIAFQLSFMWTCAELLDGPWNDVPDDNPTDGNFSH